MTRRSSIIPRKFRPLLGAGIFLLIFAAQSFGWFDQPVAPPAQQQSKQPAASEKGTYQVSRFIDGDTFAADVNGKDETIRIIGIDTPETHAPGKPVQCYGPAASAYLKTLIGESEVTLENDPKNDNRDRYGRLLRHVYLPNSSSVALAIIQNGYGFAYTTYPFTGKEQYIAAEAQARAQAKGLWANCNVTQQGSRKQTAPLQ
jgi:micrococcal nuclease